MLELDGLHSVLRRRTNDDATTCCIVLFKGRREEGGGERERARVPPCLSSSFESLWEDAHHRDERETKNERRGSDHVHTSAVHVVS